MDTPCEQFQRLRHAWPGMKRRIIGIAEHAPLTNGRNRRIPGPEPRRGMWVGPHLPVEDDLRPAGYDVLKAEARPRLRREIRNIARIRESKQFIQVVARTHGN